MASAKTTIFRFEGVSLHGATHVEHSIQRRRRGGRVAAVLVGLLAVAMPLGAWGWGTLRDISYKTKDGDGPLYYPEKIGPGDIVRGDEARGKVCFTFDDGPDFRTTPVLLDQLDRHAVKAAFFVNGWKIHGSSVGGEENRAVLRQIARRGHFIGNHTFSHKNLTELSEEGWSTELTQVDGQITATVGNVPKIFRPPFGVMGPVEHSRVSRGGYRVVMWTIDTLDWQAKNAAQIVKRFARVIEESPVGGIVVMHDTNRSSVEAFPLMMEWLAEYNRRQAVLGRGTLDVVGLEQYLKR